MELSSSCRVGYVEDLIFTPSLDYTAEFLKSWHSDLSVSTAMGQTEAVRAGAGIGILHGFMAGRHDELVPVLPANKLQRSYWTVIHEDLRAVRRVDLVADFLAEIVTRERTTFA